MAKAKRVRWECPRGEHPAVLGSTRPLRDATVRYCLPCSEVTGRLVERVSPALERKRAAAAAKTATRQQTKRARERAAERRKRFVEVVEPDGSIGELDVRATLRRSARGDGVRLDGARGRRVHAAAPTRPRVHRAGVAGVRDRAEYRCRAATRARGGVDPARAAALRAAGAGGARTRLPDGADPRREGVLARDEAIWRQARALHAGTLVEVEDLVSDDDVGSEQR